MKTEIEPRRASESKPSCGHPLSAEQARRVKRWPCDGIARFTIKGGGHGRVGCTYSEAYEIIFLQTNCRKNGVGRTFSREGIRRISALNEAYWAAARKSLSTAILDSLVKAAHIGAAAETPMEEAAP